MNHDFNPSFQNGRDPNAAPFNPSTYYYNLAAEQQQQQPTPILSWDEVSCLQSGAPGHQVQDAVHALAFDPLKELLWVGTASGMLHAHHAADMSRIVSSYITEPSNNLSINGDVRDIVVSQTAVLAAVGYGLAVVGRGGVLKATVCADTVKDAKALALNPLSDRHVCIGGESRMLALIDLENSRILRQATLRGAAGVTDAEWAAPDGASNIAIFSTATGRISLCDPSSMREVNAIAAFAGAATSLSVSGYYLAATGVGSRGGVSYLEQHVKLFDIRAPHKALPSVVFPAPPMYVAFDSHSAQMYNADGALWVLAPNGVMQLLDISGVAAGSAPYPLCDQIQLDAGTDILTSIAVSNHGLVVMGDTGGFVHQWACSDSAKVNEDSEPLWTVPVPTEPPTPSIRLDELLTAEVGTSIPKCAIPDYEQGYLTDELFGNPKEDPDPSGPSLMHPPMYSSEIQGLLDFYNRPPLGRFPLAISDEIVGRAHQSQSIVGYAQAPASFVRNSEGGHKKAPVVRGQTGSKLASLRSRQKLDRSNATSDSSGGGRRNSRATDLSKPAQKSTYVEMDLVAWESIEGFNFLQYNRSGLFCGLENALPNVYVNAVVQILYFTPPIRIAVGNHVCNRDWCISCELGFLFHMFDLGGAGMACEAGNFTRAFMTMANAGALGLLDGHHALPLAQRLENFSRYLLEQLHKDEELSGGKQVPSIFGAYTLSYGSFMTSKTKWERQSLPFQHTLSYDGSSGSNSSFCDVLEKSLFQALDPTRAFCEQSGQFETMSQRREVRSLPNVLMLGCNTKAKEYGKWWLSDEESNGEKITKVKSGSDDSSNGPEGTTLDDIAERAMGQEKKLVISMKVDVSNGISVTREEEEEQFGYDLNVKDGSGNDVRNSGDEVAVYDLSFVIAHVAPFVGEHKDDEGAAKSTRNVDGHIVAYIRVPKEYREKGNTSSSAETDWWCFNDFVISPCSGFEEVAAFHSTWKTPCLLGYVRRDVKARVIYEDWDSTSAAVNVAEVLGNESRNEALGLQADEEAPGKGSVLALDCEFVMVSRDEANIFPDGSREVVVPARMALARVSVIRGYGKYKGSALLDDYVAVREPVVDYVTRFSGLVEGDLQEGRSRYTVSSLKSVYKRLRCLVDAGCVFVGHGLKSDFRIINFVVPPEQVIDTVTLFRVSNKRLLGLRFLSHALLGDDIQGETHDSIEDSRAALGLYDFYKLLTEGEEGEERLSRTLKDLYTYGYANGFQVAADNPFVVDFS